LKNAGSPVTVSGLGGWIVIGAEQTGSGYEVALHLPGSDQYTVWNTDSGNVASNATGGIVSGSSYALESLEPSFHQDLNGDGTIGVVSASAPQSAAVSGSTKDLSGSTGNDNFVFNGYGTPAHDPADKSLLFVGNQSSPSEAFFEAVHDLGGGAQLEAILLQEMGYQTGGQLAHWLSSHFLIH
jgi:hypothetical protein